MRDGYEVPKTNNRAKRKTRKRNREKKALQQRRRPDERSWGQRNKEMGWAMELKQSPQSGQAKRRD